jgi:hypothetical protein
MENVGFDNCYLSMILGEIEMFLYFEQSIY